MCDVFSVVSEGLNGLERVYFVTVGFKRLPVALFSSFSDLHYCTQVVGPLKKRIDQALLTQVPFSTHEKLHVSVHRYTCVLQGNLCHICLHCSASAGTSVYGLKYLRSLLAP